LPTPTNLRASGKRTHSLIKIRWSLNGASSVQVTHYEIQIKKKKEWTYKSVFFKVNSHKLSATFTKLESRTHYCFHVRSCNEQYCSEWSEDFVANTRTYKVAKVVTSPAVFVAATVSSPFLGTLVGGALGNDAVKSGTIKKAITTTAGAAAGATFGLLGAPISGGVATHYYVRGTDDVSDQSDDDGNVF